MIAVTVKTEAMKRALAEYGQKLSGEAGGALVEAMSVAQVVAVERIRAQTKRRTGKLEDDWGQMLLGRPFTGRLFSRAKYSGWINDGTEPHVITAKRARVLSFVVNGQRLFRRRVNHPGTKARPFAQPAARAGETFLHADLQRRADSLASAFSR